VIKEGNMIIKILGKHINEVLNGLKIENFIV